ncbi:hypothetical protein P171DRAFT_444756 [Karstenula rhodostoma CBS 690.94]|uniref:Uncharacterized protein n=1 Tax=Karstenula rhodostoma CBS 690.94 TaxID=1392251 RepID=A0A9P4PHK8_9PLEO|nr:hypothetical protein P171DRAFT_444756 [Karstenula rhodostoma CBS 690.94]
MTPNTLRIRTSWEYVLLCYALQQPAGQDEPLRLSEEVVAPDTYGGELFGASFINKAFEEKLEHKLRHEIYLVENVFENNDKRRIDVNNPSATLPAVQIDCLRENPRKLFYQKRLQLRRSTAVARGAVLRALNKRHGPTRVSQCSYGFLMSEPYQPEIYEEHMICNARINKADGQRYVDETIRWVIQSGIG